MKIAIQRMTIKINRTNTNQSSWLFSLVKLLEDITTATSWMPITETVANAFQKKKKKKKVEKEEKEPVNYHDQKLMGFLSRPNLR